jgi:hypothetical protein
MMANLKSAQKQKTNQAVLLLVHAVPFHGLLRDSKLIQMAGRTEK